MDAQKIMEWKDQAEALLAERGPRTSEQMAELTHVRPAEAYQLLEAMTEEGRLFKTRKERYALPETLGLLRGRLQGNARGFGFLIPEKEDVQDVFIPADAMNGALHGDTLFVRIVNVERREGEVVRVLTHANDVIVGTFETDGPAAYVVPDERRIASDVYVSRDDRSGAKNNDKVVVRVTQWGKGGRGPRGRVIEVLGNKDDIGTDVKSLIRQHKLDEEFPQNVLAAAAALPQEVDP